MSNAVAAEPLDLQLWFGDVLVADLRNALPHQGTWFAEYRQVVAPEQGRLQGRLCEFIRLCECWNERLAHGETPDAREFDPIADVIESEAWRAVAADGDELRMAGGPSFTQGEASWNHPECEPSRETAAWLAWAQLTGGR